MSLGVMLDVAIGLALVFLVFSLAASGLYEGLARILSWRAKTLWVALHRLVEPPSPPAQPLKRRDRVVRRFKHTGDEGDKRPAVDTTGQRRRRKPPKVTDLYAHPLIGGLEVRAAGAKTHIDHVASSQFARALVDLVVPDGEGETTITEFRDKVKAWPKTHPLRRQLLTLTSEVAKEMDDLRTRVEQWFDAQMAALTQGYKKRAKWYMLFFGLVVAVGFNVNAVHVTERLFQDPVLREALADQGAEIVKECGAKPEKEQPACYAQAPKAVQASPTLDLPVGWDQEVRWRSPSTYLGWGLSAFALMQGGPFWYDLLKRVVSLRRKRSGDGA